MVERLVVLKPAAGGLRCKHHVIPEIDLRDHEILTGLVLPDHDLAGNRTPSLTYLILPLYRQFHKPFLVGGFLDQFDFSSLDHRI